MARCTLGPAISVVIPTYERRERLMGALASVFAQSRPPAEILVVDDGSTDGTSEEVAARYGDDVQLIRQPNQGPSAARNAASRVARGDVIAFLDSDNRWLPHHVQTLVDLFALHPAAVLVATTRNYWFGDERPSDARAGDVAEDLLLGLVDVGYLSSVGVRRGALEATGGFDERFRCGEDTELYLRLALQGGFALISATTVKRGLSPDSLAGRAQRAGGYLGLLEKTADRVLAALDAARRPDADALRAAARARRARGATLTSLAGDEPPETVGRHLRELRRWAPGIDDVESVLRSALWIMPGLDEPGRRARLATTLLQASALADDAPG